MTDAWQTVKPCDADAWVQLPVDFTVRTAIVVFDSLKRQLETMLVAGRGDERIRLGIDRQRRIIRLDCVNGGRAE